WTWRPGPGPLTARRTDPERGPRWAVVRPGPDGVAELNLPVAIVLSVSASIAFAGSAVLQHEAIGHQMSQGRQHRAGQRPRVLSITFFRRLLQRPLWWAGCGLSGAAAGLDLETMSGG